MTKLILFSIFFFLFFAEVKTIQPDENEADGDSCSNNLCRNHGICRLDKDLGFRCLCPIGISGPICLDSKHLNQLNLRRLKDDVILV